MAEHPIVDEVNRPSRPDGWDPRQKPTRYCPIWKREVHVAEACPKFCGKQYVEECKYADRAPRPDEMKVASPIILPTTMDVREVERIRKAGKYR